MSGGLKIMAWVVGTILVGTTLLAIEYKFFNKETAMAPASDQMMGTENAALTVTMPPARPTAPVPAPARPPATDAPTGPSLEDIYALKFSVIEQMSDAGKRRKAVLDLVDEALDASHFDMAMQTITRLGNAKDRDRMLVRLVKDALDAHDIALATRAAGKIGDARHRDAAYEDILAADPT